MYMSFGGSNLRSNSVMASISCSAFIHVPPPFTRTYVPFMSHIIDNFEPRVQYFLYLNCSNVRWRHLSKSAVEEKNMKNPNGYGTIRHYKSGRRSKPYGFFVSTKIKQPDGTYKNKQVCLQWFSNIRDARKFQAQYNDHRFNPLQKDATFQEIYEKHVLPDIKTLHPPTQASYKSAYKRCASIYDMKVRDIKRSHIKSLLLEYSHLSANTLNITIVILNKVFEFCVAEDLIIKNPAKGISPKSIKAKEERTAWTREEVQLVRDNLDYVPGINAGLRTSPVRLTPLMDTLLILFYTGLRIEELLGLKTEDVHLEERWMMIRGTKTAAADRIVPIHKEIIPYIKARMNGTYLVEVEGQRIAYSVYRTKFFAPMREHFGIEHVIHETRHTFSTYSALCNFNFMLRQKMMGHKSLSITDDVYGHAFIDDLVNEIDKLII